MKNKQELSEVYLSVGYTKKQAHLTVVQVCATTAIHTHASKTPKEKAPLLFSKQPIITEEISITICGISDLLV